jgi:hypothetical protein
MLKTLVLALLLANGLLLAANLGVLGALDQQQDREPERLARQISPEAAHTTPGSGRGAWPADPARAGGGAASGGATGAVGADPAATPASDGVQTSPDTPADAANAALGASSLAAPASGAASGAAALVNTAANGPKSCLLLAPMTAAQGAAVTQSLLAAGLPQGSWRSQALPAVPQYWIVMGRFANQGLLQRKQAELRRRQVPWTVLQAAPNLPPGLAPGLSLGRYDSEAEAQTALDRLEARDVRTARVVTLPAVAGQQQLQLPALDAGQLTRALRLATPVNTRWLNCDGSLPVAPAAAVRNGRR